MFGFKVKSNSFIILGGYFPWVYMVLMVLFGGSFLPYLIGIGLGHLYIFIKDIAFVQYHKDYLPTPEFVKRWWYGRQAQRQGVRVQRNRVGGAFVGGGVRIG